MTAPPDSPPRRAIRPIAWPFLAAIRLYQWALAPLMAGHCRFSPTCSEYALGAFRTHRPLRAAMLTLSRLGRCHPLCRGGFDPVPLPLEEADQPFAAGRDIPTQALSK
jgi:putative membrane protein insertion efficiency factor